jgi:hydrogenase nickel incorporation protein HypA/HybF
MHELSIALSILEVTEQEVERRGHPHVEAIHLRIGPLSGVASGALLSAWELASEQTEFKDCRLAIEEIPITVFCSKCQAERPVESVQRICCVECDTPASEIVHGRELLVSALELAE